jgi:transposase
MENDAPIHKAKIAAEWREAKGIKKMSWPAQSPDYNPIENLWSMMKKRVNTLCPHVRSPQAMKVVLESGWSEFTPETINKLIDYMPKRVKTVIKARGEPTKY